MPLTVIKVQQQGCSDGTNPTGLKRALALPPLIGLISIWLLVVFFSRVLQSTLEHVASICTE